MPRALWSGTISFGLVSVPVRMLSAIRENDLRFHWVHLEDGGRIGYEKVCKLDGEAVGDDEIAKAYESSDGEIVALSDADFEAAAAEGTKTIEISDFVPLDEIDPIYFERTFYLAPGEGGGKVYALLARAMEESGFVAVATYVMRDRQNLGCLRVRDGVITLSKMYFADEIRPTEEVGLPDEKVGARELEMALELVRGFTGGFEPDRYHDTYREKLLDVIEAKRRGKAPARFAEPEEEPPPDLLEALRASVEAATKRRSGSERPRKTAAGKRPTQKTRERKPARSRS
jgi:DNA end-binding protein Ku